MSKLIKPDCPEEIAYTASQLIEHVFQREKADLAYKIAFQYWSLDDCRQHIVYQAIKLQWLTSPDEGPSPDRLFLALIFMICPGAVLASLHPTLRDARPLREASSDG